MLSAAPFLDRQFRFLRGKLLIGRAEDCDLRPDSQFVSAHHCVFLLDDYTLRIRDLGSKNGTFVNGHRIGTSTTILLHNDLISIGDMNILMDFRLAKAEMESADSANGPAVSPAALQGTGVFDGDTLQAEIPGASPGTSASPSISPPPRSSPPVDLKAGSSSTEEIP